MTAPELEQLVRQVARGELGHEHAAEAAQAWLTGLEPIRRAGP
jgi:hypothetical protein